MLEKKIHIGKISYINASPVYYGLEKGLLPSWLKMVPDVPAVLNKKIMTGELKISPISAAFYAMNHKDLMILPDLSISCDGRVMSVLLASNYPLDDLSGKRVLFSQESASAAAFLKMIFISREIVPMYEIGAVGDMDYCTESADAVLVIGDVALTNPWYETYQYCFDLGQLWYEMTALPFVFALWAVRKDFAMQSPEKVREIHRLLLNSKEQGYQNMDEIIRSGSQRLDLGYGIIKAYFELLHCDLDAGKIKAMARFFDSLFKQGVLSEKPGINFF